MYVACSVQIHWIFPPVMPGQPSRLHQPTMAASVTWGCVVVDLDDGEGAVGLFRPIRRVEKLCQRGEPYCTQGVSVIQCADGGLYQPMRRGLDLDGHAAVGLPQPTPRVAEYLARCGIEQPGLQQPMPRVHVCADTLLDVDSDSDVAPTELDSDSDEDIGVLPVAARVTWAVPEFVIIFIASVGKAKRIRRQGRERVMRGRGTLQDIPPPGEDSEDEESDDDQGSSETAGEQWLREQLYQPYLLYQQGEL